MAILGQMDLVANTNNLVVALSAASTVNIHIANRTGAPINISVALVPSGTGSPANQHWIDFQDPLDQNEPLEIYGVPLSTGDQVFVNPSGPGVSCTVVGLNI